MSKHGKGYSNYMNKKFFHPGNFENVQKKLLAEQKMEDEKNKLKEKLAEYERGDEMSHYKALLGDEKAKIGLNFMYEAPPGLPNDNPKKGISSILSTTAPKLEWQRKTDTSHSKPNESTLNLPTCSQDTQDLSGDTKAGMRAKSRKKKKSTKMDKLKRVEHGKVLKKKNPQKSEISFKN